MKLQRAAFLVGSALSVASLVLYLIHRDAGMSVISGSIGAWWLFVWVTVERHNR